MLLLPYILVPLIVSFLRRRTFSGFTYLLTLCLLFFYPQIIQIVDEIQHPPLPLEEQPGRCLMGETFFFILHYLAFLPATMIFQFIFNFLFARKKYTREEADAINK